MKYSDENYNKFVEDMTKAGLKVNEDYCGRFFYRGPAVVVADVQDALSLTKVKCQWDHLGKQFIVYPK